MGTMAKRYGKLAAGRGEVHFSWKQRENGAWVRNEMWGRTGKSGSTVEKNLDHLVSGSFDSEGACRLALERAAKAWLYDHR